MRLTQCAATFVAALFLLPLQGFSQPYGLQTRPSFEAFASGKLPHAAPTLSGDWSAVVAFPNLTFLNPMGLLPVPGTSDLVVWEREGRIYQFSSDRNTSNKTLVLDISQQCQGWDDSGLMGLAYHPGFETNRYLFIYYTYVPPGTVKGSARSRPPTDTPNRDRLERYTLDANGVAIPESATIFIDQISETVWHNGGGMFFHPEDGFLYLTNGDDARGANNQRVDTSLHSGVLRIDVDQRGGSISHPIPKQPLPEGSVTANYYIPNDNPLVGQPDVLEEFFAIGLRSPHRMTIDPPTGRIFIGDVGQASFEELDLIEPNDSAPLNFQWNRIEGEDGSLRPPYIGIDRPPLLDYPHSDGAAIIGGYVYRGTEFAADLGGKYIFGDNIANVVWVLDESTSPPTKQLLCSVPRGSGPNSGNDYVGLSSFGYDHQNELYLCQLSSLGGKIYKLQRGGEPASNMPVRLSETGVFEDLASLQPSEGLVKYEVNSPLWSDGALKTRWFGIPDGEKIGFSPNGEWTFPAGSVWVKHFDLTVNEASQETKRLETRVLVRDTNGYVYGASYKWRQDNSDADIVVGAETEDITITLPGSESRIQQWYYPSQQDCLSCHTRASGGVLGMKTRQSNCETTFSQTGVTDNQLRAWNNVGYFEPGIEESEIANYMRLVTVTNTARDLEFRVRSYFDANCSHCHRPGGTQAGWDARIETPLEMAGIIGVPAQDDLGIPGAEIIAPLDIERSVIHKRMDTATERYKMPPLAKNVVDRDAVNALAEWINSLSTPPTVAITTPAAGTIYHAPATIRLTAEAESANGPITRVEYFSGETKLGESTEAPYTVDWPASLSGSIEITAFATDSTGVTGQSQPVSIAVLSSDGSGLLGEYFDEMDFTGTTVTRVDATIDFDWGEGVPIPGIGEDTFSVRWTGRIRPRFSETYTFSTTSDDGVRLWINDVLIIDQWIDQSATTHSGTIPLTGDQLYSIRMEMYENEGDAVARLEWSSASQDLEVVPASALLPPGTSNSAPTIVILAPTAGSTFHQPEKIRIEVDAADNDGNLTKVEFFAGEQRLGEVLAPPFSFDWALPPVGVHILTAKAVDALGIEAMSAPVSIAVEPLSILTPALTSGGFELRFAATDGSRYEIEYSEDLIEWVSAGLVTAADGVAVFAEAIAPEGHRFYRVTPLSE